MVLNLDKCIGCQTCSVTCKNVWTTREGIEYAWFNNVETKPGVGYPQSWENQHKYAGGWIVKNGRLKLLQACRAKEVGEIFANPYMPTLKDYYDPYTFDFSSLKFAGPLRTPPTARPYSIVTGKRMEKIEMGPNWEDDLGGEFRKRSIDPNLKDIDTVGWEDYERTFMMWLPRLCNHCLNPACVAACPSGAIYKRDEDGIVLIDESKCRGWRECVSACPYKKIYFNWRRMRSEKCIFCYPRVEDGQPPICAHSCVGRIRYVGVMLYDQDKISVLAATPNPKDLYEMQMGLFLDPNDSQIEQTALEQGISQTFINYAKKSPVWQMIKKWKIALPLHPEFRTFPMQWYIPPLSPEKQDNFNDMDMIPDIDNQRIPLEYLANIFTAGNIEPVREALQKLVALRRYMRKITLQETQSKNTSNIIDNLKKPIEETLDKVKSIIDEIRLDGEDSNMFGLSLNDYQEMYQLLAIADYDKRFVIPTRPIKQEDKPFNMRSQQGFPTPWYGKNRPVNLFGGM